MKRLVLAALAALVAFAMPAAAGGHYVYIPIYIPAAPPQVSQATVGSYNKIHKVAVLSAIGSQLELEKWNPLVPDDRELDISSWGVDDKVKATFEKYLGSKFSFVDIPFDRAKLAAFRPTIWHAGQLTGLLKSLPNSDVDAFLVVYPDVMSGIQLESGQMDQVVLWVRYVVELIDAHTYKTISSASSRFQVREGQPKFPGLVVGDAFKLDKSLTLAPDKLDKLHKLTMDMLDVTLVETIRAMQFGVPLPPVGDHSLLPPPPVSRTAGIKTLAVYSALGDRLQLEEPGGTFSKGVDVKVPIADWGLDGEIEDMVRSLLGKNYTFKDAPVDRSVLQASQWWDKTQSTVKVPATDAVDAYLLVVKDDRKLLSGLGLWHDGNWVRDWTYAAGNYVILLVDAKTQKIIALQTGVMDSHSTQANPSLEVDNAWWPKKADAIAPAVVPQLHEALLKILRGSLPESLYEMGMNVEGGTLPVPADTAATALPRPQAATAGTAPPGTPAAP